MERRYVGQPGSQFDHAPEHARPTFACWLHRPYSHEMKEAGHDVPIAGGDVGHSGGFSRSHSHTVSLAGESFGAQAQCRVPLRHVVPLLLHAMPDAVPGPQAFVGSDGASTPASGAHARSSQNRTPHDPAEQNALVPLQKMAHGCCATALRQTAFHASASR